MKRRTSLKPSVLKRVLGYVGKYPISLVGALAFALFSVAATLCVPVFFGDAIDCIIEAGKVDFETLKSVFIKTGVAIAIAALSQWLSSLQPTALSLA